MRAPPPTYKSMRPRCVMMLLPASDIYSVLLRANRQISWTCIFAYIDVGRERASIVVVSPRISLCVRIFGQVVMQFTGEAGQ